MPAPSNFTYPPPTNPARPPILIPTLYARGGNGDTITFNQFDDGYYIGAQTSGIFGVEPRNVRRRTGVGHGSRWAGTQRLERPMDFTVGVRSPDVPTQRARLDRLADIFDDVLYGPATLGVIPPEKGPAGAREIPVHYLSGMEGVTDRDRVTTKADRMSLSVVSPRPTWRATQPETAAWTVDPSKPFLSDDPDVPFFPARLGTGRVLGTVTLDNPGNVESQAVWTITGPGGPVTIHDGNGRGFILDVELGPGEVRVVNTEEGTVVDAAGNNRFDDLATVPPPELWTVPPRLSTATVDITGATQGASVVLQFWPEYRRPW